MMTDGRLNTLVDAAFAFALTLMVTGGGQAARDLAGLDQVLREAPSFLVGFILITMFWHAHVRWRRLQTEGGVLASLLLVFLVLIYVHPLRVMTLSLADFLGLGAGPALTIDSARRLFVFYGLGFMSLSTATAWLFWGAARAVGADANARTRAWDEFGIWMILGTAGAVSLAIAGLTPLLWMAPWVYALLPLVIGVFGWRRDRRRREGRIQGPTAPA